MSVPGKLKQALPSVDLHGMSGNRLGRLFGRAFELVTPHVKEYQNQRNANLIEGRRLLAAHNYEEAEKYLHWALADRSTNNSTRLVEVLAALAEVQIYLGRLDKAETFTQSGIQVATEAEDKVAHSAALEAQARLQLHNKQFAELERTLANIEELEKAKTEPNFARLAQCARMEAAALRQDGRAAEALQAAKRAAELSELGSDANVMTTADLLTELGTLHAEQGDHQEAQTCIRRALDIHRTTLGAESAQATKDMYLLAASLEQSGDIKGAASEYERLLAFRERQVGGNRMEAAKTAVQLAILYLQDDRIPAARELLMHAIPTLERSKETRAEDLQLALSAMAHVEEQYGRDTEAENLRQKAATLSISSAEPARP